MLAPRRTIAPAVTALSLVDAKAQIKPDTDEEDSLIGTYIDAAVSYLDGWHGVLARALITQTWEQDFECFSDLMRLPLDPVQSITSIAYFDENNVQQTLDPSVFQLLTDGGGPFVTSAPDQDWPSTFDRLDAITVTFVAGYGDAPADVPASLRHAMLLMVTNWFENREAVVVGTSAINLPLGVDALLQPYRRRTH